MSLKKYQRNSYIFSILTSLIVGIVFAIILLEVGKTVANHFINKDSSSELVEEKSERHTSEESDEDPSFVSRFSRVFIYSRKEDVVALSNPSGSKAGTKPTIEARKITAKSYIVINLDKNSVLLEKDADRLLPIASITKLVTAVIAKKLLDENKSIEITKSMINTEGTSGHLRLGEKLKVKELFYPLLMVSSNDTAEALARAYGREKFIKEMNTWASSIGAYKTYFQDPSGLSPKNVSSARDLTLIANWIRKNEPELFEITLTKTKTVRAHTWVNPTHFLNLDAYKGGKNGFTPEAKLTNVSLFEAGNPPEIYSVVLLGSSLRDADTLDALQEALK